MSPNPDFFCLLPFLLLPPTCFIISRLMGEMSIERIETSVEASSSDLPVANHVAIYWTPDYVLCVWCFNRNINYLQYFRICTRSSLTSGFQMETPFDILSIDYLWETTGSLSKYLVFMVSESKKPLHFVVFTFNL